MAPPSPSRCRPYSQAHELQRLHPSLAQLLYAKDTLPQPDALIAVQIASRLALTAQVGSSKVVAHNIAVGHVILASGQSNMFISLADIKAKYPNSNWAALAQKSIANAPKDTAVRLFKVSARSAEEVCSALKQ